jgi:predicted DsbA family dithiol-disulfide isomerase
MLLCDPETGICEVPGTAPVLKSTKTFAGKPVQLLYFTDPICSSCWGIEPQLRKLKMDYGDFYDIEYRMGGLLQSWDTYGGRDVSGPNEVARHWDEVSIQYDMPIDGDIWLEDPLSSSYPPSIAFKAAQMQNEEKALVFLRRIKEMVFLEKKNIAKWEHLQLAAAKSGLDIEKLKTDFDGKARELFEEDLKLAKSLGVRGFPTIFFTDGDDNRLKLYGAKPYAQFEQTFLALYPEAVKSGYYKNDENLFTLYPTLTSKEFALLTGQSKKDAENALSLLENEHQVEKYNSKNGPLWRKK